MRFYNNGVNTIIDRDSHILQKVEGKDLNNVEVGRVDADILAKAYDEATKLNDFDSCARYAKLKEKYLNMYK